MPRKSNTRAAQGSGSIRQRADGTWEARFVAGHDPGTGKPIRKSVYAKTQKEARQKLAQIRPRNLGQASRVSGVSPADVAVLMVYLGK